MTTLATAQEERFNDTKGIGIGLAVYALDLRGRGRSDGERFYVEDVADYVSDVAGTIAIAKSRHPGLPVFLLGHSAGGVVSATYVLDHRSEEHTSELQSLRHIVCRLLFEKKKYLHYIYSA